MRKPFYSPQGKTSTQYTIACSEVPFLRHCPTNNDSHVLKTVGRRTAVSLATRILNNIHHMMSINILRTGHTTAHTGFPEHRLMGSYSGRLCAMFCFLIFTGTTGLSQKEQWGHSRASWEKQEGAALPAPCSTDRLLVYWCFVETHTCEPWDVSRGIPPILELKLFPNSTHTSPTSNAGREAHISPSILSQQALSQA